MNWNDPGLNIALKNQTKQLVFIKSHLHDHLQGEKGSEKNLQDHPNLGSEKLKTRQVEQRLNSSSWDEVWRHTPVFTSLKNPEASWSSCVKHAWVKGSVLGHAHTQNHTNTPAWTVSKDKLQALNLCSTKYKTKLSS